MSKHSIIACVLFSLSLLTACQSTSQQPGPDAYTLRAFNTEHAIYHSVNASSRSDAKQPSVQAFLGIPYAQAPVGDLRWNSPKKLLKNSDAPIVVADKFAPACMQGPHIANWYQGVIESFGGDAKSFPTPEVSEDCLYLNIWRPTDKGNEPLPVMVYIHGGSNKGGWAYEPNYLGQELAKRGVIVVSIAYRLGVFGFFSHPNLVDANFALQDQIAALQWIKQNIAAVGGDPARVAVVGESAGASNIAYLMASPKARGLFNRAIHQSGGWAMYRTAEKQEIEPLGLAFAKAASGLDAAPIAQLRELPSEKILHASERVYAGHFYDPVIDGDTVVRPLDESAGQGGLAKVDLMIGTNANESRMYLPEDATLESLVKQNLDRPSKTISIESIRATLSDSSRHDALAQLDQLATAYNYTCPSFALAQANSKFGGRTWFYNFTKQRDGELGAQMGAYHGAELPYVFNTHDDWLPTSRQDKELTESIMQYWVNFISFGNPNSDQQAQWPNYNTSLDPVQFLGVTIKPAEHPSARLCELLAISSERGENANALK